MDSAHIVICYAQIVAHPELQAVVNEALAHPLEHLGATSAEAADAIQLIPIAFARHFMADMGITFSDRYWIFGVDGDLIKQGLLMSDPIYEAAVALAPKLLSKEVVEGVICRSAEFNVINESLNAGSRPEDLRLAPVARFRGNPTEAGIKLVQSKINAYLKSPV
jgi:hypothetical protein